MERNSIRRLWNSQVSLHGLARFNLYADMAVFTEFPITLSDSEWICISPRVAKISLFVDFKFIINKFDVITQLCVRDRYTTNDNLSNLLYFHTHY